MSMSYSEKIAKIVSFGNDQYYPSLKAINGKNPKEEDIIITDEILNRISQNICNKCNDVNYIEGLDVEDYFSLLDMFTNGGVVYKDDTGSYYEEENKAFTASLLGNIAATCDKNGTPLSKYSLGEMVLPTQAEENISGKRNIEDFIMFLTGDSLGYHKKHGNVFGSETPHEDIEEEIIYDEPSLEDITPSYTEQKKKLLEDKKEAYSSFREQLDDLSIDDLKTKTL